MNKKIISIISVAILVIVASMWLYFANRFERMVQETILPKIKDYQEYIDTDIEKVIIDKYKFKLAIGKIIILDDSDYSVEIDGINFSYNPLSGQIRGTNIPNGKIIVHQKHLGIASKSKKFTIKFSNELFKDNKVNSSIFIGIKGITQYLLDSEEILISNEEAETSIEISQSQRNKDNLSIIITSSAIGTTIKSMKIDSEDEVLNRIMEQFGEMFKLKGDMDYNVKYELDFEKEHFPKYIRLFMLLASHDNPEKAKDIIINNNLQDYEFFIEGTENAKFADNDEYNFYGMIKNDGKRIILDLDFDSYSAPNDEIDEKYTELVVDFIRFIIVQQEESVRGIPLDFNTEDYTNIARMFVDINKAKLSLKLNFDHKFVKFSHKLLVDINDHAFEFYGKKSLTSYKGNLKISKPQEFVNFVSSRLAESFKPIFISSAPYSSDKEGVWYDAVVQNIKDNGFDAMKVFHNKDNLKEGEPLIADIRGNFRNYSFKINDKNFFQIMSDERLMLLFKNMPGEPNPSNQNNDIGNDTNELPGQ